MFDIYKRKKVFITGHTGFKGSWLSAWLLKMGAKVYGFSHQKYPHYKILNLSINYNNVNIKSYKDVIRVYLNVKPDIVFHLAAQPLVRKSFEDSIETFNVNINGTVNLCEAMKNYPPKVFIGIVTDKIYEDKNWEYAYRENDILGGFDPYACSKVCMKYIIDSYKKSFLHDTYVATTMAGNCLGGGDWGEDRIIPDIIRAYENKEKFKLRNPHHIRPWNYILDVLAGYLMLGEKLLEGKSEYQGAWNFGPDLESCITTQLLINKCIKYWPELKDICRYDKENDIKSDFHETKILRLDSTKARTHLGWKPKYSIDETIDKTMEWYCKFFKGIVETNRQIEEYEKI